MQSVLVIILKCETRDCDPNIKNLKNLFTDDLFVLKIFTGNEQDFNTDYNNNKKLRDNYLLRSALLYAKSSQWKDLPCLIIKDSSVCQLSTINLKNKIIKALKKASSADLHFLCKWNDVCEKYFNVDDDDDDQNLKWAINPTSTQAIIYKPSCRDYLINILDNPHIDYSDFLNRQISNKKLFATIFVPNLINYDINLATSKEDYKKLNECATGSSSQTSSQDNYIYIWLILIFFVMILFSWFVIKTSY